MASPQHTVTETLHRCFCGCGESVTHGQWCHPITGRRLTAPLRRECAERMVREPERNNVVDTRLEAPGRVIRKAIGDA